MKGTFLQIFQKTKTPRSFVEPIWNNQFFDNEYDYWDLGGAEDPNYWDVYTQNYATVSGNTNITTLEQEIINLQPDTWYNFSMKGFASGGTIDLYFRSSVALHDDRVTLGESGIYSVSLSGRTFPEVFTFKTSQYPSGYQDALVIHPNPEGGQFAGEISAMFLTKNTDLNDLPEDDQFYYSDSAYLDVVDDLPVPLNYTIDAVENPLKKDSNWSKTITLPASDRNKNVLAGLHDDTSTFEIFNVNNRAKCIVWSDGVPVFNGWFQLLNVARVDYGEGGKEIEYEARVYSDTTSILNDLSKKPMNELDFSNYDHQLSLYNVVASWVGQYENLQGEQAIEQDLFVYPLLFSENTEAYKINDDFLPAVFARKILDESFIQNGYSVSYSTGITQVLDNLIIPYIGKKPLVPEEYLTDFDCKVSGDVQTYINTNMAYGNDWSSWANLDFVDSNAAGYNSDLYFNLATNKYEVNQTGQFSFDFRFEYEIDYTNSTGEYLVNGDDDQQTQLFVEIRVIKNDGTTQLLQAQEPYISGGDIPSLAVGTSTVAGGIIAMSFQENLILGEEVYVRVRMKDSSQFAYLEQFPFPHYVNANSQVQVRSLDGGYLQISPSNFQVTEGATVQMSDFIPKMKQGDLLKEFQKLFNWLYLIDPAKPNHLHLVSRREYYENGEVLDWTSKLDNNAETTTEFLTDVLAENMVFSYKEADDKDELNSLYSASYGGDVYGQKEVVFDNDFVQDEIRIGPKRIIPTPFTKNAFNHPVPAVSLSSTTKGDRLLYWGGFQTSTDSLPIYGYDFESQSYTTTTAAGYPLNIHLNSYTASTIDINYGLIEENFAGDSLTMTENNLYNLYWKDYVRVIQEGRRLTARFYLDQKDIQELEGDLSKKIFLYNKYWIISKIKDYFPNKQGTTEVELVSWFEATDPQFTVTYSQIPSGTDNPANPNNGGDVPVALDDGVSDPEIIDNGDDNEVSVGLNEGSTTTIIINGNTNKVDNAVKTGAILAGNDEYVYEDHQVILNKDYMIVEGQLQQRYFFVGGERSTNYNPPTKAFRINEAPPMFTIGGRETDGYPTAFKTSSLILDLFTGEYDHTKGDFIAGGSAANSVTSRPHDPRYPK